MAVIRGTASLQVGALYRTFKSMQESSLEDYVELSAVLQYKYSVQKKREKWLT